MTDSQLVMAVFILFCFAAVVAVAAFKDRHMYREIPPILASLGWIDVRKPPRLTLVISTFRGSFEGMPVSLQYAERQKVTPHEVTMINPAGTSGSLLISARVARIGTRRMRGRMNVPRTGMNELFNRNLEVRTDDRALAKLVLLDAELMAELNHLFGEFPGIVVISRGQFRIRNWITLEPSASFVKHLADNHPAPERLDALLRGQWSICQRARALIR